MKSRIRVSRCEISTRMSEMLPDPTADMSSKLLPTLVKATIRNAAPRSLGAYFLVVICSPVQSAPRLPWCCLRRSWCGRHGYDDLASCAPGLEIADGVCCFAERIRPVNDRRDAAGLNQFP